jgi:hypothetical protein
LTIYLPDVNVWIALAVDAHPHHAVAKKWFEELNEALLVFCRVTEMGLLRLLTNAHVMSGQPLSARKAWEVRLAFESDTRIQFSAEPEGFEAIWRKTARAGDVGSNFWTDAYLSSFCAGVGATMVTFDRRFGRRTPCRVLLLKPA